MSTITTRPMSPPEFDAWRQDLAREYAEAQVAAGNWDRAGAIDRALTENARLLPNGIATKRMRFVQAITEDGDPAGRAWVSFDHPRGAPDTAFLYDIQIVEEHRGRGFGKILLADVEKLVADAGIGSLELNVFGENVTAIALYERSGYAVVTQQMRKTLDR